MAKKPLFNIEDLREAGVEDDLGKRIIDCTIEQEKNQRHSTTGKATLDLEDRSSEAIFYKIHCPRKQNQAEIEFLRNFHLREGTYLNVINGEISEGLVPRLRGRLTSSDNSTFYLFASYLGDTTREEKYLELAKQLHEAKEEGDEKKISMLESQNLDLMREDLRIIARNNGLYNLHEKDFPSFLRGFMEKVHESQVERFPKYINTRLLQAVHWNWRGRKYKDKDGKERRVGKKFKRKRVLEMIDDKIKFNLDESLEELFKFRQALTYEPELGHGDCRLQHNIEGVFCDLDYFGYHPPYHDVAKYFSEEIATLPVSKIPSLLGYYLLHKKAYSQEDKRKRARMINRIEDIKDDETKLEKMVSEHIGTTNFADFVLGYFKETIEDNVVVNGSRKKYSEEQLSELLPEYPGYSYERLQRSRMERTENLYSFIASLEAGPLFMGCSNSEGFASYFTSLGKILNGLGLTEIRNLDYLEKVSEGSQYTRFFSNGNGKQKSA